MITLNLDTDGKKLKFTYAVANIDPTHIKGKFVMEFGGSNVSFPIRVSDNFIVVELRTSNIFLRNAAGKIIKAKLEIVAGEDTFIVPWVGEIEIIKRKIKEKILTKADIPVTKSPKKSKNKKRKKEKKSPLEEQMDRIRYLIDKKEEELENGDDLEEDNLAFSDFLNTPAEEIIFTKEEIEERKKEKEILFNILNTPINELMDKLEE